MSGQQAQELDSLRRVFKKVPPDSTTVNTALALGEKFFSIAPDSCHFYWQWAEIFCRRQLSENKNLSKPEIQFYQTSLARSLNHLGYFFQRKHWDVQKALDCYNESLSWAQKAGNGRWEANTLNNLANVYDNQGDIPTALEYYNRSRTVLERMGDQKGLAICLDDIGNLHRAQGDLEEAEEFCKKSLKLSQEIGAQNSASMALIHLGAIYTDKRNFALAVSCLNSALDFAKNHDDYLLLTLSYRNLAYLFDREGKQQQALEYQQQSLQVAERTGYKKGATLSLLHLSKLQYKQKDMEAAVQNARKSLAYARETGIPLNIKEAAAWLSTLFEQQGDYRQAMEMYKLNIEMRDSVINESNRRSMFRQQVQYEFDKKEAIALKEKREQRMILFFTIAGLLLTLALAGFIYRNLQLKKRQHKVISAQKTQLEKDKEIIGEQAEELKSLERLKSRFFANVSHELRTPLTLMLGPVNSLLKRKEGDSEETKLLQYIQHNARQLQKLINEILDLSKLEANKLEVVEESVHFLPYLNEQLAQFQSSDKLDLKLNFQVDKSLQLLLDKGKFEKIVHNFLSNAMKFTTPGGTVTLTIEEEPNNQLELSVSDTGSGIHPDDLPYVFDRFYQSKQPDAKTEGGTGIGLSLCKELAMLLGGDVRAESDWGKGSVFYFTFPKKVVGSLPLAAEAEVVSVVEIANPEHLGSVATCIKAVVTEPNSFQKASILVVEDNADLREYLKFILSGYNVVAVKNGKLALDLLKNEERKMRNDAPFIPDLIISDLMMPVMDGFQLLEKLKSDDRWRHIPIIMLTAKVNIHSKLEALRIGVDDYLTKPFEEEELKARIENLLRNYRERMEHFFAAKNEGRDELVAEKPVMAQVDNEWLKQVETIFSKCLSDNQFNLDWVASQMNLSQRQFSRRLQQLTGLTPNHYLQEMRLQLAKDFLLNGQYTTVKETSFAVGFRDTPYFSTLFQERFGVVPSAYLQ